MTEDTMFWIASTSKAVTGTLVAMLIEEGKLHPDDPIEKHLPEFKGQMVIDRTNRRPHPAQKARRIPSRCVKR